jgi:ubiquinone/menaquinone biosynthesis C-methylase UbiE
VTPLSSDIYDRDYFLSDKCEGWDRFRENRGLSPIKRRLASALGPGPGVRVLDAGCGRGEVLLACANKGALVAGVDYAEAAVELTRETLADVPGADVRRADLTALPWPAGSFDRVLLGDVIEHVDPAQTVPVLAELERVLAPGGSLLVHTAPNRLFTQVAWPLARPLMHAVGQGEAAQALDERLVAAESYHVNEQSLYGLRRSMRAAGFATVRAWVDPNVLRTGEHFLTAGLERSPAMRLAGAVAATRPVRVLLGNDLYAIGIKASP